MKKMNKKLGIVNGKKLCVCVYLFKFFYLFVPKFNIIIIYPVVIIYKLNHHIIILMAFKSSII